jgi:hypothetical protein
VTKLLYAPCKCVARGNAFIPGMRGHLYAYADGKLYFLRTCRHCRTKDNKLVGTTP